MTSAKAVRPAFQSIELDAIDAHLEAVAAEKGIPTLVNPKSETPLEAVTPATAAAEIPPAPKKSAKANPLEATPRSRMKPLNIQLPDYAWVALKKRAAEEMVTARYFIMQILREKGIPINDIDMMEDGRRLRD